MIIECPSCHTQYFMADEALEAEGRKVTCNSCHYSWHMKLGQRADQGLHAPRTAPSVHVALRQSWTQRQRQRARTAALVAWAASGTLAASAAAGATAMRGEVVEAFPKAATAYAAAGLPVNRFGHELADIRQERVFSGTTAHLLVSGRAVPVTAEADGGAAPLSPSPGSGPFPLAEARLLGEDGRELGRRTAKPGAGGLFEIRFADPPAEAWTVEVRFAAP